MNRRQKRRLVRNAKILAVCGAIAYMAVGVTMAGDGAPNSSIGYKQSAYLYQIEKSEFPELLKSTAVTDETYQSEIHSYDLTADDAYLLMKIAMAEAEGEDIEGKALVMLVVLNRVRSNEFPESIEKVIYQEGQFSPIGNGRWDAIEPNQDCLDALTLVEHCWDESLGAMYFESKSTSKWHRDNLKFLFQHGNHYFYADKESVE